MDLLQLDYLNKSPDWLDGDQHLLLRLTRRDPLYTAPRPVVILLDQT